jgi:cell division protein FtsI/penicillin-binding protein 2
MNLKSKKENKGQRRIIRPGPRGDIFDRNGRLLIGNKAHFLCKTTHRFYRSRNLGKKKELRNASIRLLEELKAKPFLEVEQLISYGFEQAEIKDRFIRFSGNAKNVNQEPEKSKSVFSRQTNGCRTRQQR